MSRCSANSLKLQQTLPTDPNYSSIASQVSQTHGSLAAQMMTQRAEVRAQVFKVLTPAQQTQLTALEAQMRTKQAWPLGPSARPEHPRRNRQRGIGGLALDGADPVFLEQVDHTARADQVAGADDDQIVLVVVEQGFDLRHPLAVARDQHRLIEPRIAAELGLELVRRTTAYRRAARRRTMESTSAARPCACSRLESRYSACVSMDMFSNTEI